MIGGNQIMVSNYKQLWIKAKKELDEAEQNLHESIRSELEAAIVAKDIDRLMAITDYLPKHSLTLRRVYEAIERIK
jgi:hypothetical protein